MSNLGQRASRLIEQRARRSGRQAPTLRRQNSLVVAPVLNANLSAGASSLQLKASSGRLTGRVVKGSRFTITGVTGTYEVLADATTSAAGVLTVIFTPIAASGAAVGAAVTFTQKYHETTYPYLNREASDEDVKAIDEGQTIKLIPYDASKPAPEQGDLFDGDPIDRVRTIDADDGIAYYRCWVKEGTIA